VILISLHYLLLPSILQLNMSPLTNLSLKFTLRALKVSQVVECFIPKSPKCVFLSLFPFLLLSFFPSFLPLSFFLSLFLSFLSFFISFLPSFLSFSLFSKPQRIPSLGEHSNFYNFRRLSKKILLLSCSPVFTTHS
jgi:hypothetical protein